MTSFKFQKAILTCTVLLGVQLFVIGTIYAPSNGKRYARQSDTIESTFQTISKDKQTRETKNSVITTSFTSTYSKEENLINIKSSQTSRKRLIMKFDIELIHDAFKKCFEDNMNLEQYDLAYNELYNFFGILGTVFSFIASDVREKIDIIEDFRKNSDKKEHYQNVEPMMLHEMDVNKETGEELLGSRTLLRLHRALQFTFLFLERLVALEPEGKVSTMALEAYQDSLAKFHPWLIRNGAKLAMYALPIRKEFIKKIVPPDADEDSVGKVVLEAVEYMKKVYIGIEELYTKHDLHGLP